jgi:hypothetical protein
MLAAAGATWFAGRGCGIQWAVRSSPATRWTLALALAAGVVGACRQVIGIDQYFNAPADAGSDAGSTVCGPSYGTATCASCVSASCCSQSTACAADQDPTCAAYESCFGNCNGAPKCWAQCLADFPASGADVTALSVCMATHCETQCSLACGAFAATNVQPDAAISCQSCIASKACAETRACARSSDCDAIQRCVLGCATQDCRDTCYTAHGVDPAYSYEPDGGNGGVHGLFTTAVEQCQTQCGFNDWSCVGHESWPAPESAKETLYFWVKDYSTGLPVAGADVALCGNEDIPCAAPFATATTNMAGAVSLPFQNAQGIGGQLGVGLTGFLMVTSPTIRPYYYYWGYPLSQTAAYLYGEVTTPESFQQISASLNVIPDPRRGTVGVAVYCCSQTAGNVAGVQVNLNTADAMTQSFTPTGVATNITDSTGLLVFGNVPAGNVTVTAIPTVLKKASSTVTANVRAGATTQVLAWAH